MIRKSGALWLSPCPEEEEWKGNGEERPAGRDSRTNGSGGGSCDPSDGTAASTSNSLKTKNFTKLTFSFLFLFFGGAREDTRKMEQHYDWLIDFPSLRFTSTVRKKTNAQRVAHTFYMLVVIQEVWGNRTVMDSLRDGCGQSQKIERNAQFAAETAQPEKMSPIINANSFSNLPICLRGSWWLDVQYIVGMCVCVCVCVVTWNLPADCLHGSDRCAIRGPLSALHLLLSYASAKLSVPPLCL